MAIISPAPALLPSPCLSNRLKKDVSLRKQLITKREGFNFIGRIIWRFDNSPTHPRTNGEQLCMLSDAAEHCTPMLFCTLLKSMAKFSLSRKGQVSSSYISIHPHLYGNDNQDSFWCFGRDFRLKNHPPLLHFISPKTMMMLEWELLWSSLVVFVC